jgi:hypothetical protein
MRKLTRTLAATAFLICGMASPAAYGGAGAVLFQEDFEKKEVGKPPAGFLIVDGGFTVKEEEGNKFLELPGAPLDAFAAMFGPAGSGEREVKARIYATGKGRRYPTFAVGLNGQTGFRLQAAPSKKALELLRGEEVVKSIPFEWTSGAWTVFRLKMRRAGDGWIVEGKAWTDKSEEPKEWLITHEDKEKIPNGQASIWGNPYSNTPLRYDDLVVTGAPN